MKGMTGGKGSEEEGYQKLTGRWPTHISRRTTTNLVPETVFKYLYVQNTPLTTMCHPHYHLLYSITTHTPSQLTPSLSTHPPYHGRLRTS